MNVYFLRGNANDNFEGDESEVLGCDQEGILVECNLDRASELAREWELSQPMLAKDGVHYSESGDVVYIANGKQVDNIETVAEVLDYPGFEQCGLDEEDYLHSINRIF